jgi:hypothetical protein
MIAKKNRFMREVSKCEKGLVVGLVLVFLSPTLISGPLHHTTPHSNHFQHPKGRPHHKNNGIPVPGIEPGSFRCFNRVIG